MIIVLWWSLHYTGAADTLSVYERGHAGTRRAGYTDPQVYHLRYFPLSAKIISTHRRSFIVNHIILKLTLITFARKFPWEAKLPRFCPFCSPEMNTPIVTGNESNKENALEYGLSDTLNSIFITHLSNRYRQKCTFSASDLSLEVFKIEKSKLSL